MRKAHFLVAVVIALVVSYTLQFQAHAAPAGPLIKHITSLVKWTKATSKAPQSDGDVVQFENGYVVETVAQGNEIGVIPYKIRVSEDGELYAVDEVYSNIVKITPPLSQYSRGRLVAGSFQGLTGHVDGKPSEARFNHPKGVTMDDKGNVYVADTQNLAIRKIGDSGVVTIAGGKSNVPGYRDGPSEDAKFSNDFDVVYVRPTCSLLVVDRGNAALRQISLNQEDCDYQSSSISTTDVLMVVGAVLVGYMTCVLQQGFGAALFSKTAPSSQNKLKGHSTMEEATPIMVINKEEPGWPSFGQLIVDLLKFGFEWLGNVFSNLMPSRLRYYGPKKGLTPLKDTLKMPEDEAAPSMVKKQYTSPIPVMETREAHAPSGVERYPEMKPPKIKSSTFKDPSLSSKHRSSKRSEYAEFYGSNEVPPYTKPKSQKERSRHRQREKSEVGYGSVGTERKPVENRQVDYDSPKFDPYNMRTKYKTDESFRF